MVDIYVQGNGVKLTPRKPGLRIIEGPPANKPQPAVSPPFPKKGGK